MDDFIHLPAVIEKLYGWPRSVGRAAIALGKVEVDGEVVTDCDYPKGKATVDITVGTFILDNPKRYYNPRLALEFKGKHVVEVGVDKTRKQDGTALQ